MAILSAVISLVIILALVTVPLALIARLSFTVLARLLGVVSQSEVATRAEFARIREQLLATAGEGEGQLEGSPRAPDAAAAHVGDIISGRLGDVTAGRLGGAAAKLAVAAPAAVEWRQCPTCTAIVPSTASICLQCGAGLSAKS